LPSLLADAGGRGIQIMPVVHGVAQLRARWGRDGARTILDACGTKVFLPGSSDPETLEMASRLSGQVAARERGAEHDTRHPVMTEDMIRQLPARRDGTGYAFVLRNGLSPVIGRPPVIWRDRSARRLARRARQAAAAAMTLEAIPGHCDAQRMRPLPVPSPVPAAEHVPVPVPAGVSGNGAPAGRARRPWDQTGATS